MPKTADLLDTFKKAGLVVAGFVGGREIERKFFKNDEAGFKRFIGPILLSGGGVLLCTQKNEPLKYIGYGLTGAGVVSGVGKILNKDIMSEGILSGLTLGNIFGGKKIPGYDPKNLPPSYVPQLPEIHEDPVNGGDINGVDNAQIV